MKKKVLGIQLFLVGTLTMLLTSCLGDAENSQRGTNEFMYITEISGQKYAAYTVGYLINDEFSKYETGTCLRATYKVNFDNSNISGVGYKASEVIIDPENVYPKSNQFVANTSTEYPSEDTTIRDAFQSVSIEFSVFNNHWGDRWLFAYSCEMTEDEKEDGTTSLEVYYNSENQDDGYGNALPAGECVLDVVLRREGAQTGEKTTITSTKKIVDFSTLRRKLEGLAADESSSVKTLKFRFRYLEINKQADSGYKLTTRLSSNTGLSWNIEAEKEDQ